MIKALGNIVGHISTKQSIKGKINNAILKIYPVLEDLEVTPSNEEQVFKSKEYGFNEVRVKKVEGEELNIIPSTEEQVKEGLYEKVTVSGDSNLVPENIKGGVEIFKVKGTAEMADEELVASFISLLNNSNGANITKLPNNLTEIGTYSFYRRTKLTSIKLPETVTSLGQYSFDGCTNLETIELPEALTKLDHYAFNGCTKLLLTKLPESVNYIGSYTFYNCKNITLTELPEGITQLNANGFNGCTNLALTKLPSNLSLTSANNNLFANCINITIKELPNKITTIPDSCFYNCKSITKLTCQGAITSIGRSTFYDCTNLTKLVMLNITKVPTLSYTNTFQNTPIALGTGYIYVPDNLIESFKTATNWSIYANQIKGTSEMEG